jgi:hypothetical protein
MSDIVNKLWGFCHSLRHDGIDYGDYIEQITYLLFLKMADEKGVAVPKGCDWPEAARHSRHRADGLRTSTSLRTAVPSSRTSWATSIAEARSHASTSRSVSSD